MESPAKASLMDSPTDPDRFANLPRLFVDDVGHVMGAPLRWDRSDWVTAGATVVLVVGTGVVLDQSIDSFVVKHANASSDRLAKAVQNLGGAPSVAIAGGTYLTGIAFKNPEVRATGIDLMATMGIAQLLVVLPAKVITGRSRPEADLGAHDFHPFNGGQSFPSGHTTQAFALASVISAHADQTWVSCVSYGLAGMVGLARMEQRQHFMSDVVAGGLIGTLVGKSVVSYNESRRTDARSKLSVSFAPLVLPGGYGLSVAMKF
jgi:membrane-associated phospholipid phosphatase